MASLKQLSTGKTLLLEPHYVVGRGFTCNLRLTPPYVSALHAELRWTEERWELRDLASRNGTFLNGERLKAGEEYATQAGAKLAFGSLEEEWEFVDASPPPVMATPLDGGDPVIREGEFLVLPSPENPVVTIFERKLSAGLGDAGWFLEAPGQAPTPIANQHVFECAGRSWRFTCPPPGTQRFAYESEILLRQLHLVFTVSRDEERVHVQVHAGARTIDLGARAHHFLLVTLARRRLEDRRDGHNEIASGWIDHEDLDHDPRMSGPQLNIDVFRIRKQFEAAGVIDAVGIIERRPMSRQLRIGVEKLTVVRE